MTVTLEGFHAVKHALRFAPHLVGIVTVTSTAGAAALCAELAPDVADLLLARAVVGAVPHPTGVQAIASRPVQDRTVLSDRTAPLVVLDDPRHPGNVGAVIRVAAAAGACGVVVGGDLDPWGASVLRGSAGLHYALPVLSCSADEVRGPVLVLSGEGRPFDGLPDDAVLVVGSERAGVGVAWRDRADDVIALPMRTGVSSLNLATAVAATLYCWRLSSARPGSTSGQAGRHG